MQFLASTVVTGLRGSEYGWTYVDELERFTICVLCGDDVAMAYTEGDAPRYVHDLDNTDVCDA